jgi:asparagine synthase (glutamine-hydrolysing)
MCGIAGWWDHDADGASSHLLESMLDTIVHRGPDDRGAWSDGPVALGQVRLTILDLSQRAHQPLVTADGQGVLVYNGEVYNYPQLRRQLEREGVCFRSTGDTEVVLSALHTWGPGIAIPRFDGMFAFAYFDRRERALWLARDRLGIKPLYTAVLGRRVRFASEIKALLAHPDVARRPDLPLLGTNMTRRCISGRRTCFEDIEAVAPGTHWKITERGREETVYFDVISELDVERLRAAASRPFDEMVAEFEEVVSETVEMHLASDAPLAVACSGGVDSSYVSALARRRRPDLRAYVADVVGDGSEAEWARRVGRHIDMPVSEICARPGSLIRLFPAVTWFMDQPSFHPSDLPLLLLTRGMREGGVKAVLTGEGADELFGGYGRYRGSWRRWRRWRRRRPLRWLFEGTPAPSASRARLFSDLETASRGVEGWPRPDGEIARQRDQHRWALFEKIRTVVPIEERALLAHCLVDFFDGALPVLLHRMDRMGMGASVEMRVPFLENRTIDLGMHLPFRAKLHDRQGKWILKTAAAKHLPPDVVFTRKRAFPVPSAFFDGTEELLRKGIVPDLLEWDRGTASRTIASLCAARAARYHLVALEVWARLFLRSESPDDVGELLSACATPVPSASAA